MYYTREQHKRFLDKELIAISEEYLKKLNSKAIALLTDNEVYVTQFVKLDLKMADSNNADRNVLGSGQLILRFKKYIVSGRVKQMTMVSYCVVLLDCQ